MGHFYSSPAIMRYPHKKQWRKPIHRPIAILIMAVLVLTTRVTIAPRPPAQIPIPATPAPTEAPKAP